MRANESSEQKLKKKNVCCKVHVDIWQRIKNLITVVKTYLERVNILSQLVCET